MRAWLLLGALLPALAWAQPIVLGAALPLSGQLADLAGDMQRALTLWQESRNAAGGLLGRRVELRLLDDHSEASAAAGLYEQLVGLDRADLLVGPYGSAASIGAASVAERRRRVMVIPSGVTRSLQRAGSRYVFQLSAPLAGYGDGALEIARAMDYRRLHIVARGDPVAREAAGLFAERAKAAGLEPGVVESVAPGNDDYRPQIARARARDAQAWIAFGQPEDAADMVKSFKRIGYAPWMFLAQGAAEPRFSTLVGRDGEFVLGLTTYDTGFRTPGNAEFVEAWRKRWSAEPGAVAAHTWSALLVLEEAARRAGGVDAEALRSALAALELETLVGRYRVAPGGLQSGVRPAVVQIVGGRRDVVWPEALATAKWRLPYPRWDERQARGTP